MVGHLGIAGRLCLVMVGMFALGGEVVWAKPAEAVPPEDVASTGVSVGAEMDRIGLVGKAADEGRLLWRLTEPDDLKALLGEPSKETSARDGGMETLVLDWPGVKAFFARMHGGGAPYGLHFVAVRSEGADAEGWFEKRQARAIEIGRDKKVVLRDEGDLKKLDDFWGFANVSLVKLDLREHEKLLRSMPFDSRTEWPSKDRMPAGFVPSDLLEKGKEPGLGVRGLHGKGIDGRGVRVAIIDQPLNRDHREYADRLESYEVVDIERPHVAMHGAPVASILVGKSCGVAPGAMLSYYAVPSWKRNNGPYCKVLDSIVEANSKLELEKRVRVVSISTGMFSQWPGSGDWQKSMKRATESGLLVLTCADEMVVHGTLKRKAGADGNDFDSYEPQYAAGVAGEVMVPAGGRTTAGHEGPDVYTYWVEGGKSWATPYLAGVVALGFQVNPKMDIETAVRLLRETGRKAKGGLIVDPVGFVEAAKKAGLGLGVD